jgi:hypothetical protein
VNPTLEDIKGNQLSTIADGKFRVNKSGEYKQQYPYTLVDAPTGYRDWVWQIACDEAGLPAIAMVRIDRTKNHHQYYYAKWTGDAWRLTDLAYGGGRFHPSNTEYCYSGGMALDPECPGTVYLSVPTKNAKGENIYEIWQYLVADNGQVVMKDQITRSSENNNVRPFVLPGSKDAPMRLFWMHGDYAYWIVKKGYPTGFPTAIHAHGTAPQACAAAKQARGSFTLDIDVTLSPDHYYGTLLTTQSFSYGLDKESVRPYVEIGGKRYYSTNALYTSDNWAANCTGTHGDNWPTLHPSLHVTFTYDGHRLTVYRHGLIDQVIEAPKLKASQVTMGDLPSGGVQLNSFDRCFAQDEVKTLFD